MVHSRFNQQESNPNPHINFLTALPAHDSEDARQYLRALAAQVRPIMKGHGFEVNSLEEYEYNTVFAGRNWNNGETIELVLRRPGGSFLPASWLMSTLCHELAHIKHMNHGPAFQALWQRLRNEVRKLQNKGYYGDGYWSAGTRLVDSAVVPGQGLDTGELPEYICGGAQSRARPSNIRQRRGPRRLGDSSNKTGKQSAKPRKAGSRVTSKYAFQGEGLSLTGGDTDAQGKGFRKQAGSKRAREERALATERRLQAQTSSSTNSSVPASTSSTDSEDEDEDIIAETDSDRRKTLLAAEQGHDLAGLQSDTSWKEFENDFVSMGNETADVEERRNEVPSTDSKVKRTADVVQPDGTSKKAKISSKSSLVSSEITFQKKDALGTIGKGRTIGESSRGRSAVSIWGDRRREDETSKRHWSCLVCTLENEPLHLACAACGAEKGQTSFTE